jgi:fatty-acyl-CoA synthase
MADPARPPHIGVLLENVPDYLFWLVGAALAGAVVVGINSTYRGAPLEQLIRYTDCQIIVTSAELGPLLEGIDPGVDPGQVLVVDTPEYEASLAIPPLAMYPEVAEEDLFLLIFTSGSTGLPKAVRCTQGRLARTGVHVAGVIPLGPGDVVYSPLPFFHSSSLFTGWSSAFTAGVPLATRRRFSASNTLADMLRYGATVLTYTGKVLNYILAVPESGGEQTSRLKLAIGNEASARDIAEFARRFRCRVSDAYGATEGIIIIRRDESMPPGALGRPAGDPPTVKVLDAETGLECPPAEFDDQGRVTNLDRAVGEIVETSPTSGFEGYYKNEVATAARFRDGAYWSGDLAYRDRDGWFYFAGRSNEWLRVDGENFAAAPVEAIIARHPAVKAVAVYAVPDDPVGDRVMAAVEARADSPLEPGDLDFFLTSQSDLGTKWRPHFIRLVPELPKLASMKIDKQALRRQAWNQPGVWWRPSKEAPLVPLTTDDRQRLAHLLP